ncbi:MAG: hypothetical protein WC942_12110 [Clostridia bacterium]
MFQIRCETCQNWIRLRQRECGIGNALRPQPRGLWLSETIFSRWDEGKQCPCYAKITTLGGEI